MKKVFAVIYFLISLQLLAQTDYYTKKGVAIEGYDVTEYFNNSPKKGIKQHAVNYQGAIFYFANEKNKSKFEATPKAFLPQYGGYCAYAIGSKSEKVKIDPETYEIREGKLYLFYNAWGTNTLDLWNKEGAKTIQAKADSNWKKMNEE